MVIGRLTQHGYYPPLTTITLVAGTIAYVDVITSYFLLWNLYIVEKIPFIGDWMRKFRDFGAEKMKEKTWIKKVAFVGVALFVVIPFQGSGGVGASILGRVVGMNKYHAWLAIIVGSFSGCFLIASASYYIGNTILKAFDNSMVQGIGILLVLGFIFVFLYFFFKHRNQLEEKE
ncbi:MAG: small multi-drug export protein [Thermoplasmata archaeon]